MMKTLIPIIALALVIGLSACGTSQDTGNGSAAEAAGLNPLQLLNEHIKQDPNNPDHFLARGKHFFEGNDKEMALKDADRALALDPDRAEFHLFKANVLYSMMQTRDARAELNRCIMLEPENVEAHLKLGEIYLLLQMHDEAFTHINSALRVDMNNATGYFIKGMVYLDMKDTATALSSILTAIEQNPDYYTAYVQAGVLLAGLNDPLAEGYFNNAIKLRPNSIEAIYNRSIFIQEHGQPQAALDGYLFIITLDPDHYDAHFNQGYIKLVHLQDYAGAVPHFEQAIRLHKKPFEAHYNLGYCYELLDNFPKAEEHYRASLEIEPAYEKPANGLSRIIDGDYRH